MSVVLSFKAATLDSGALALARYAQIIRYSENAFFGINAPDNRERACRKLWSKLERDMISRYLLEAQERIESILGYPLRKTWYADEPHKHRSRFFTTWARVQELGVRTETDISLAVPLIHTADPATFEAVACTVIDESEIHFYQAGTTIEIYPSSLTLESSTIIAEFPRARLVKETFQDTPEQGLVYADVSETGPFCQTIDIKRIYTNTDDPGEFVWPLGSTGCPVCGEDTNTARGYIQSNESGIITFLDTESYCCGNAPMLRINYVAGETLTYQAEEALIHLAHALMPVEPCSGCDSLMMLWKQDRNVPDEITQDRADCLFGVQEGAWRAWNYVIRNRRVRMSYI